MKLKSTMVDNQSITISFRWNRRLDTMKLNTPITQLKGIGEKTAKLFNKLGVYTIRDILLYFPSGYLQYPESISLDELVQEGTYAIQIKLQDRPVTKRIRQLEITTLIAKSGTQKIEFTWFGSSYISSTLHPGEEYIFYGKVIEKMVGFSMTQPQLFLPEKYKLKLNTLQPLYSLTKGLSNTNIQKFADLALQNCDLCDLTKETLPEEIVAKYQFPSFTNALKQIHFPENIDAFQAAKKRLVYEEFYHFLLQIKIAKSKIEARKNNFLIQHQDIIETYLKELPFSLTNGQLETLTTIQQQFASNISMQRLLQGDVGCGKTIVAFLSMVQVALSGYQSLIMAPTDVLARQHYDSLCELKETLGFDLPILLLTGSLGAKEKKHIQNQISQVKNAMIIGTHALFQEAVEYSNLAYVVIDEQHRFGVKQREMLCNKNDHPHLMVMSATPIPRTLAMILYGDLSISTINELPAQRIRIKNCVIKKTQRKTSYDFIEKELIKGHQAYVICHLIEESEQSEYENVIAYQQRLTDYFQHRHKVGLLHGKMNPSQKEEVMKAFLNQSISILVATTVIEVGINVPNATVMMIEDAQAFGLSQLHQLRGRVGRGNAQSYCIMVDTSNTTVENKRLAICNQSNDGFEIAQKDLELRGPGDFFGIRQSGDMNFRLADIYQDAQILQAAACDVDHFLKQTPNTQLSNENSIFGDCNFSI